MTLLFAFLTGCCLALIQARQRLPFLGGLLSSKMQVELDRVDKWLAWAALLFFVLTLIFVVRGLAV